MRLLTKQKGGILCSDVFMRQSSADWSDWRSRPFFQKQSMIDKEHQTATGTGTGANGDRQEGPEENRFRRRRAFLAMQQDFGTAATTIGRRFFEYLVARWH
jgi:hypothetical protein